MSSPPASAAIMPTASGRDERTRARDGDDDFDSSSPCMSIDRRRFFFGEGFIPPPEPRRRFGFRRHRARDIPIPPRQPAPPRSRSLGPTDEDGRRHRAYLAPLATSAAADGDDDDDGGRRWARSRPPPPACAASASPGARNLRREARMRKWGRASTTTFEPWVMDDATNNGR
jgi:hypothetical protein